MYIPRGCTPLTPLANNILTRRHQDNGCYDEAKDGENHQQGDDDSPPVTLLCCVADQFLEYKERQTLREVVGFGLIEKTELHLVVY